MRTTARFSAGLLVAVLVANACGGGEKPLAVSDTLLLHSAADVGVGSAPTELPLSETFDDLNPCSGSPHSLTISGTVRVHDHNGRMVATYRSMVTTSSGFTGRANTTVVLNGQVQKITVHHMLRHPSGDRIRAHSVVLVDVSTSTVRVVKFVLACAGRAT